MSKFKTKLLPSLREKKRYLIFEIISNEKLAEFKRISNTILQRNQQLIGEIGMSKGGVSILHDCWNEKKQRGIIRVNPKYLNDVKTGLSLIKKIGDRRVIFKTVGVSGVLKKAKQRYLSL